jgi:hypothetical protein
MYRLLGVLVVIAIVAGGLAVGLPALGQGKTGGLATTQWEYASLYLEVGANQSCVWETAKKYISKNNTNGGFAVIYSELGGKEKDPKTGMLLDQVGKDGWELVSHVRTTPFAADIWTFKRPARP